MDFSFQYHPIGLVDATIEDGIGQGGIVEPTVPVIDGELTGRIRSSAAPTEPAAPSIGKRPPRLSITHKFAGHKS
jgi:hypothetical protein